MDCKDDILSVQNLVIKYYTDSGTVSALNGIDLSLKRGETLGIVGETGAGKTTLARGIMGLIQVPPGKIETGKIYYENEYLLAYSQKQLRKIRGVQISMIFQDPMTSLNPVMTVGDQISEVIRNHTDMRYRESIKKVCEMLELVGISSERIGDYPHQFSGGMKQRVMIAIALACNPKLLIADEPTTALDVTIQAQILEMMSSLKSKLGTSVIMITHDLGIVAQNCDRVCIMYAGEVVEHGGLEDIFKKTSHPYTKGLLDSIPILTEDIKRLIPIKGSAPDPTDLPKGCKFKPRCNYATKMCDLDEIPMHKLSSSHFVKCAMSQGGQVNG